MVQHQRGENLTCVSVYLFKGKKRKKKLIHVPASVCQAHCCVFCFVTEGNKIDVPADDEGASILGDKSIYTEERSY